MQDKHVKHRKWGRNGPFLEGTVNDCKST